MTRLPITMKTTTRQLPSAIRNIVIIIIIVIGIDIIIIAIITIVCVIAMKMTTRLLAFMSPSFTLVISNIIILILL